MDVKMGTRTFQESEVGKPVLRLDLLEKMVALDPSEPTDEERRSGITKQRYMQFRERESTSASLGFRIEGIQNPSIDPVDCKKIKDPLQIYRALSCFLPDLDDPNYDIVHAALLARLNELQEALVHSEFFQVVSLAFQLFFCDFVSRSIAALDASHSFTS
eukprot:m.110850 g.110850  ORF g.110850 m.110850 type:complete len:160 (-) comp51815_c0_seq9:133-612(-)